MHQKLIQGNYRRDCLNLAIENLPSRCIVRALFVILVHPLRWRKLKREGSPRHHPVWNVLPPPLISQPVRFTTSSER